LAFGCWLLARFNLSSLFIFLMLTVLMTLAHTHAFYNLAVGCWLLAVGFWLLAVGCWLLAVGGWLLAIGFWLLAVSVFGCRFI